MAIFSPTSALLGYALVTSLLDLCYHPILGEMGNKCDEDLFYLPYVHVRKKKNGGNLAMLKSSGFLDLRFRNRVVLCINGPVVLYSDAERLDAEARLSADHDRSHGTLKNAPEARYPTPEHGLAELSDPSSFEEIRFKKGVLHVYSHQCISINKVPMNVLKKMKEDQGRSQPELMTDTQTMGKLVLGIYLIGNKEGYNKGDMAWFKGINYEYIKSSDKTVKDSSFIVAGKNSAHCMRLPDGTHVKISSMPTPGNGTIQVCKWTVKEEDKPWYARVFQRGFDANGVRNGDPTLDESDYEVYECPDEDTDRNIILTMSRTTPEPVTHVNYTEFDPFSLFNPNQWTPHGFRRDSAGLSGGDERAEDRTLNIGGPASAADNGIACALDPSNPGCMDDDLEITTMRDMQNVDATNANSFDIIAGECIDLPIFDIRNCTGIGDNGQRLLELVLELEPWVMLEGAGGDAGAAGGAGAGAPPAGGSPGPPAPPEPPKPVVPLPNATDEEKVKYPAYLNMDADSNLKWKYDILYLVSDIFRYLCMPFRPEMPYTVARVFSWYVYKAHVYGEEMGRVGPPPAPLADKAGGAAGGAGGGGTPPAPPPPPPPAGGAGGAPGTPDAAAKPPPPPASNQYDYLIDKTPTWTILEKELERCKTSARSENGGKGLKFMWEVGDDGGRWKYPSVDGRPTRRRKKRSPIVPEHTRAKTKRSTEENDELYSKLENNDDVLLSRHKRHTRSNASLFYNKYILPGKTLTPIKSEGTSGFVREAIQEFRPKPDLNDPRADAAKYMDYPENIHHCWNPQEDPVTKQIVCTKTEELFFYEDRAEIEYELNIAIDIWWKIWATVIGYCNKAYHSRKSETFPRLYNSMFEHFFDMIQKEWKFPEDNLDLKIIFSEYLTEESHIWLDACLEASYINSNSHSFRPPRPMSIEEDHKSVSNFFEEIPPFIYYRYHPEPNEHGMG